MRVVPVSRHEEWLAVLHCCPRHDFYHLPAYHALAQAHGEGDARLFVHEEGEYVVALPLLVRPVRSVPGLEEAPAGWHDAAAVYGYSGPVASHDHLPDDVAEQFREALTGTLRAEGVVTLFCRLHPLLPQAPLLNGLGTSRPLKRTVAIDLTQPPDVVRARYRKSHKMDINRLRRLGVVCREDADFAHLDTFVDIYHETMRRVEATADYFFPRSYFEGLVAGGRPHVRLFVGELDGRVICAGLFFAVNGIIQYHLGGSRAADLGGAPTKLLIETVRLWGQERGDRVLHLGGGATNSPDDTLLHFKTGFSDQTYEFRLWRWVLDPAADAQLREWRRQWNDRQGLATVPGDFFPAYRAPGLPAPGSRPQHGTVEESHLTPEEGFTGASRAR